MTKANRKGGTTIRELASAAGTSISTVSFVLNGSWRQHRIKEATAEHVLAVARQMDYQPNQRARGLRMQRSSLAGMIVPHHRNRFFAGLIESFESEARQRSLVPIVVSTQRDHEIETQVVETLVAQQVELMVIAGVRDPEPLNRLCLARGVRCVNVDLPGANTFSVVTDNVGGARSLTRWLLDGLASRERVIFLGGRESEYATDQRVSGFMAECQARSHPVEAGDVLRCGYSPLAAKNALETLFAKSDRPPSALLVNSITAFEGFAMFWHAHPELVRHVRLACFDWDPFAACLPLDTVMLRQDMETMIATCFEWFDRADERTGEVAVIPPRLMIGDPSESLLAQEAIPNADPHQP
ncbi:LacI family DNA-binding transcriptional regulator [Modicisalibacter coralii]|uniref:LacI family DNA-binding transcriptional regulator n=1 Tax=Modicisalibacter coralii TaxID=2304602 RepID=UPI00100B7BF0|nr:LacI family DNA-binding transcriptional regulator [Halomonas coralii]